MNLVRYFNLLSLVGIVSCLSSELLAMEPLQPEPRKILSQTLDNEIISVPFTYMCALKMQYKEYNEEAFTALFLKGIQEKMGGNLPVAINAFLEAASYRKIPAFKFLAQCYKQSGHYVEAFKWMMWAGQESVLQDVKFEWPEGFCDGDFGVKIFEYGNKGIVDGKKIGSSHKLFLTRWSNAIKCLGKPKKDHFTQQILSNSYEEYPSQLEPYLTREECQAKKYLFKTGEQLEFFWNEIATGRLTSKAEISRIIAAFMTNPTLKNLEIVASVYIKSEDFTNAESCLQKALSLGSDEAGHQLGVLYQKLGKNKNAFDLILKSARNGNLDAQSDLGYYYLKGIGTEINLPEAFFWFSKAADQNNVLGLYNLGTCYFCGHGIETNYVKAIYYFEKAVELGDATALNDLAVIYSLGGRGVSMDSVKAEDYFLEALKKGEPLAANGYACLLLNNKNPKAFKYAKEAVELGIKGSQFLLGLCYIDGLGVSVL